MSLLTISHDDAEEYSRSLAQIGEGWWRQIAWAFRQGIPEALGMSRREWAETYHGYFKLAIPERQEAVKELAAEGMNNSQIADTLGVDEWTVRNDKKANSGDPESDTTKEEEQQVEASDEHVDSGDPEPDLWDEAENESEPSGEEDDDESEPDSSPEPDESRSQPEPMAEPEPLIPAEPGWHQLMQWALSNGQINYERRNRGDQSFIGLKYKALSDIGAVLYTHDARAERVSA